MTNLYELDIETRASRQLTTGRNADLMPDFSPDGRSIVFVTDRGPGTDLENLQFDGFRIALLDLESGQIEILHGSPGVRNINPVWGNDGESLYFISDRTGVANVHRIDVATGALTEVTRIFQGTSGYTPLSPAMTAARNADRMVVSVFTRGGYDLYRLDGAERLAGTPVAPGSPDVSPPRALLPPSPRPVEPAYHRVATYLADATGGLPSPQVAAAWETEPYRARIALDYIAPPQVGITTGGAFGRGGLYGGIAGVFSDMLARHTLYGIIQGQGQLDEIGFALGYFYQPLRWDLGVAAQRIPFISAGRARGLDPQEGVFRDQIVAFRTFDWRLQGMAQYPFSRVQRLEFFGGARHLSRDIQIREIIYDPVFGPGGQLVNVVNPRFRESREDARDFTLFEGAAALVFDNALLGFTAPVAGQRYRFEVSPTLGSLQFVNALADYRQYLWLQPFTLAGRGLHFGRYGLSVEDEQVLGPVFLAQPQLLRGYSYGDLVDRCLRDLQVSPDANDGCAVLDQVFGSHIAVATLELRFPHHQAVAGGGFGLPPVDGFIFYDAGVAWGRGTSPVLDFGIKDDAGSRGILSSAGIGGRINLFGYAVLEAGYVRPFVGNRGWHWHFALQPGF
jgi:hypothetical protein